MIDIIQRARDMRELLQKYFSEHADEDKTTAIVCSVLFDPYVQEEEHNVGDIRLDENGVPYECILAYDGAVQPEWTIHTATLWKPYHSMLEEYALPWVAPTGAHDIYKVGEYMIYTDGNVYKCIQETNYSPEDYAAAWENQSEEEEPEPTPTPTPEPEPEPEPAGDYAVWEQPDASNPYMIGDRVHFPTIDDPVYESTIDNNVWSPEAYPAGWEVVTE